MTTLEAWQRLSDVVTVVGLPFAIAVFLWEQHTERLAQEEELHQRLNAADTDFLKLVLDNADLQLLRRRPVESGLTGEQQERRQALFGILVSIFEQAYVMVYEEKMSRQRGRLWQNWADYIQEWCARADFRGALPELLRGEDPEFVAYMRQAAGRAAHPTGQGGEA